jgi:signal transduction histidine kinase
MQEKLIRFDKETSGREMISAEIGHELNNYIGAIQTNIELIDRYVTQKDYDRVEKRVKTVISSFKNINRFIDRMMDVKPIYCDIKLHDINKLINRTVNFIKPQNKYRNVKFVIDCDFSLPFVNIDCGQIEQILFNLIGNSADAMGRRVGEGGTIVIRTFRDSLRGMVCFSVTDDGPGISYENIRKLFIERFTTKEFGHGLGLIECNKIVTNHNGKIEVDSVQGDGTTFTISLPIKN